MTNSRLPGLAQEIPHRNYPGRPWRELSESGLLWLINAVVFHPRGFAFALAMDTATGEVTGWDLLGDGSEPWRYADDCDDRFVAAEATFADARLAARNGKYTPEEGDQIMAAVDRHPKRDLIEDRPQLSGPKGGGTDDE